MKDLSALAYVVSGFMLFLALDAFNSSHHRLAFAGLIAAAALLALGAVTGRRR